MDSNTTKAILQLVAVCIFISGVQSQIITDGSGTWVDMERTCDFVTPEIFVYGTGFMSTTNTVKSLLMNGDMAWVGYVKDFQIIQLTGCADDDSFEDSQVVTKRAYVNRIEQCLFLCGDTQLAKFGLRRQTTTTECYCFSSSVSIVYRYTEEGCDVICLGSQLSCGRGEKIALYETVSLDTGRSLSTLANWNTPRYNNCLTFDPRTGEFRWADCTQLFRPVCTTGRPSPSGQPAITHYPWFQAASACHAGDMFMMPYQPRITTYTDSRLWTANTRIMGIISYQESRKTPTSKSREYGYLYRSGDQLYLNFTNDSSKKYKAICSKVRPDALTTQKAPSTSTVLSDETLKNTTGTDFLSTTDSSTPPPPSTNHDGNLVAVFVCVAIAIILLTVIGILILRWLVKRRQGFKTTTMDTHASNTAPNAEGHVEYIYIDDIADATVDTRTAPNKKVIPGGHEYNYIENIVDATVDTRTAPNKKVIPGGHEYNYIDDIMDATVASTTAPNNTNTGGRVVDTMDADHYCCITQGQTDPTSPITQGQTNSTPIYFILQSENNIDGNGHEASNDKGSSTNEVHLNVYDKAAGNHVSDSSYDTIGQTSVLVQHGIDYNSVFNDSNNHTYDTTSNRRVKTGDKSNYSRLE